MMAEESGISQEAHGNYIAQATHGASATVNIYASPPSVENQNRARFLVRLRTRYRELLSGSLHGAVRMQLHLAGDPEAVAPPVQLLYETDQQPIHPLPPSTTLMQMYEEAGHELLLLGAPGSGKSTLLLELALDLVGKAEQDHRQLLPVIVPLSSWATKRQPLERWLVEQIALLYDIALPLAMRWVQQERFLPLLDGLDEMQEEARPACIEAINAYHHIHLHPLVVCSRRAEYDAAATQKRLILHHAVVVQPLTEEQVDTYLEQYSEQVSALRTVLRENPTLQEIATTPLMLSILLLTYQGQAVNDLPATASFSEQQQQIFARYVERMVARKETLACSSPQQLVTWLCWLARQMRKRNQTILYLEYLQPDWLPLIQQRAYIWLAVQLPAVLTGVLASIGIALLLSSFYSLDATILIQHGIVGGFLGELFSKPSPLNQGGTRDQQERHYLIGKRVTISLICGLIFALSFGLRLGQDYVGSIHSSYGLNDWLSDGSIYGVAIGLGCLLLQFLLLGNDTCSLPPRTTRELRSESFIDFLQAMNRQRALLVAAVFGLGYGLCYGLSWGLGYGLSWGLDEGLTFGLIFGLISGLAGLLISVILKRQTEGIHLYERLRWTWNSLMRSLFAPGHRKTIFLLACTIAIIIGLSEGLRAGLRAGLTSVEEIGPASSLYFGLVIGLSNALSSALIYGLSNGLTYWILLGLFQGISQERIEDHIRRVPNQGIYRSIRNSVLISVFSGGAIGGMGMLIIWLSAGPSNWMYQWLSSINFGLRAGLNAFINYGPTVWLGLGLSWGLSMMLPIGICGALLICTLTGGLATWRHYVIRLLLARSHTFPWHAPRFLEEATTRILLRRVGGGYSFPHRLLLDYFADLSDE